MIKDLEEIYENNMNDLKTKYELDDDNSYILELEIMSDAFQSVSFIIRKSSKYDTKLIVYDKLNNSKEYLTMDKIIECIVRLCINDNQIYGQFIKKLNKYYENGGFRYSYLINGKCYYLNGISKLDSKFETALIELDSGIWIHINDIINLINLYLLKESYTNDKDVLFLEEILFKITMPLLKIYEIEISK